MPRPVYAKSRDNIVGVKASYLRAGFSGPNVSDAATSTMFFMYLPIGLMFAFYRE